MSQNSTNQVVATTDNAVVANGVAKKMVRISEVPVGKTCKTSKGYHLQCLVEGSSFVIVGTPNNKEAIKKMDEIYPIHQMNKSLEVELL